MDHDRSLKFSQQFATGLILCRNTSNTNEYVKQWNTSDTFNTVSYSLFADDQMLLADNENDLQCSAC